MANPIEARIHNIKEGFNKAFQFNPQRRRFIKEELPYYAGIAVLGAGFVGMVVDMNIESRVTRRGFYGRHIQLNDNGTFTIAEQPQVLHIEPIPQTGYRDEGKIYVRQQPNLDVPLLTPSADGIRTPYGVRVFGEGFDPQRKTENSKGTIWLVENGNRHLGGQWLMFSDEQGTPLSPFTGQEIDLAQAEKPFYTTTDFKLL